MKIAIPSDNRETITKRTGQSKGFMVYEVNNGKIIHSEYRENTLEQHDDEAEHSHVQIIELLRDVDFLLVAAIGKHMKSDVENSSMNYQLVHEEKIPQIINNFLKSNKYE